MAFARWDPLRDLLAIQHRLERVTSGPQGWAPAVDLCETADAFIVAAELPGITRDQVRIDVHDGRLTLHGRRDARVPCEQYHQVERGHGEFSRTFTLPPSIDPERITADLSHGVLTIIVPKSPERGPRRVDAVGSASHARSPCTGAAMSRYFKQIRHGTDAKRLLSERLARKEMGEEAWKESVSHHDDRAFRRFGVVFIIVFAAVVLGAIWLGY